MGDPKRSKRKYDSPRHPWEKGRIEEEKKLIKEYGLKNKKEIWKLDSRLKRFKDLAKSLIAAAGAQAVKERLQLMARLNKLGLVDAKAPLDDVLGLTLKNIMDRRLQTLVFKKGLSRTTTQARQFITHKHIAIGNRIISSPSYLVTTLQESGIQFVANSSLASAEHPERTPLEKPKEVLKKNSGKKEGREAKKFRKEQLGKIGAGGKEKSGKTALLENRKTQKREKIKKPSDSGVMK